MVMRHNSNTDVRYNPAPTSLLGRANVWTANQTFNSGTLRVRNPASTFSYSFEGAAIVANRIITLPLLAAGDTLAVLGLAQTFSATQTFAALVLNGPFTGTSGNWVLTFGVGSIQDFKSGGGFNQFTLMASGGTIAAPTATPTATILGIHGFGGYTNAWTSGAKVQIRGVTTELWSATAAGCKLVFTTVDNTTLTPDVRLTIDQDGGLFMEGATGSSQGVGTINAVGVYDDSVLLTCYVAEQAAAGSIKPADWDATIPDRVFPASVDPKTGEILAPAVTVQRRHDPARAFAARAARDLDPKQFYTAFLAQRHLPAMPSKAEWKATIAQGKRYSTGDLINRLWETIEVLTVHVGKLEARLTAAAL